MKIPKAQAMMFLLFPLGILCLADAGGQTRQELPGAAGKGSAEEALAAAVEADWALQEQRAGRRPAEAAAILAALERGQRLCQDLGKTLDVSRETAALVSLRQRVAAVGDLDEPARLRLYHDIRWLTRQLALRNPLLGSQPLVFLQRRRFTTQMLHEYMGYYYDYGNISGGGVYLLPKPGRSLEVRDLVRGRLPRGNYTTLALSFDARQLLFAFAPRAEGKTDYYSTDRRCFHIYAIDADGGNLRPLTSGPDDNFDPCPLPDGGLAFMSSRRGGFGRCHGAWEPLPAYTLHRMAADGSKVHTLSFHETNEWHPSVLADGRIVYSRWDYVDRSAAHFHGLWASNPDGTLAVALFGNYTQRINACFQPRAIPGSRRIVFVAGAHHAAVGGSLVILDPARASLDAQTGQDRFEAIEVLTPEVCFPEAPGWPKSYFHSPWPLSENYFLVSFSFDPLPGSGPRLNRDTETGIYLFDRFGNLELLYRQKGLSCMYPMPLAPRPAPPVIEGRLEPQLGDEGELILTDVERSLLPLPTGRPIRTLRVFQVLPKSQTHVANKPRLGYANAEPARMLLGTVPVEKDGSAYFRVPARKPLYFQAVDQEGRAVQGMRSAVYLQPGERRSCTGCHAEPATSSVPGQRLALQRPPSTIQPGPDGSRPWSYPRLVQPILDAHCVKCHGGQENHRPNLTSKDAGQFTASYDNLKPFVRWYEWGQGIGGFVTQPGRMPADESPLTRILHDDRHAKTVTLSPDERRRLYLWLDGNAAFYGTHSAEEQRAQKSGQIIPVAQLQ